MYKCMFTLSKASMLFLDLTDYRKCSLNHCLIDWQFFIGLLLVRFSPITCHIASVSLPLVRFSTIVCHIASLSLPLVRFSTIVCHIASVSLPLVRFSPIVYHIASTSGQIIDNCLPYSQRHWSDSRQLSTI